jgi:hypothetical protein
MGLSDPHVWNLATREDEISSVNTLSEIRV